MGPLKLAAFLRAGTSSSGLASIVRALQRLDGTLEQLAGLVLAYVISCTTVSI